jgi:predicted nucleic acid-binding protein
VLALTAEWHLREDTLRAANTMIVNYHHRLALTGLPDQSRHRAASIPDLIVAATAEIAGLTVLHLDKDFDLIAEVTNQPVERFLVPSA